MPAQRVATDGYTPAMSVTANEDVGPVRIEIDHRTPGADGGPTLRVSEVASGAERLRFDCFARGAHWHADPAGRDEISPIPRGPDSIDWTLQQLRADTSAMLAAANLSGVEPSAFVAALDRLEPALRNRPARFDELSPAVLEHRSGEKWQQYPDDVLPLWVADMDFEIADPIRRRLGHALAIGDLGYPWHPQPTALPGLFADRMQRLYGWDVTPGRVELMTEVIQGMYVAVHQFSEPGDGIIVQRPIYPPFVSTVEKLGRRLEDNALQEAEVSYQLDLDLLREQAQRSKLLLFCNPHNPTGRVLRRPELEAIAEIVIEHDLLVVSDEIHQELVYDGARHIPIASLSPEMAERTITLTSASKAFNIAGLRLAVAVFGSAKIRKRFLDFPRHLRGGMNSLGIMATDAAWRHSDPWLAEVRAYLQANRDFVAEFVRSEMPGVRHTPPEATYLAWMDCRELDLPASPGPFFLERARVGLSDGPSFGPQGEGFARLNFSTSRAILEEALGRMAKALRSR
jgi:cystathionine beta-lyase